MQGHHGIATASPRRRHTGQRLLALTPRPSCPFSVTSTCDASNGKTVRPRQLETRRETAQKKENRMRTKRAHRVLTTAASPSPSTCTSRSRWCALLPVPHAACGCHCLRAHSGGGDVGGVGGSAPSGCASQGTSTDSQLTVAGSASAELGISEGVVGRDGAGGQTEQIDRKHTSSRTPGSTCRMQACPMVDKPIAEPKPCAAETDRQDSNERDEHFEPEPCAAETNRRDGNERGEQSEPEPCTAAARWQGGCAQRHRQ